MNEDKADKWTIHPSHGIQHERKRPGTYLIYFRNGARGDTTGHFHRIGTALKTKEGFTFTGEVPYVPTHVEARTMQALKACILKDLDWEIYTPLKTIRAKELADKVLARHKNLLLIRKGEYGREAMEAEAKFTQKPRFGIIQGGKV